MIRFLQRLFRPTPRLARRTASRPRRPGVEHLETRLMPAVTDLTALAAQLVPTPDHPTHLYLNFDGYQDSSHTVAAYNSSLQTVNDVLYRVSEIFSPFNVQVSQLYGAGSFDDGNGSSTIFIGDDTANSFPQPGGKVLNTASGYTAPQYSDYPGQSLGDQHVPHSNPFNLAFVDPIGATTVWGPTQISQAIAHEAGHTFGLGHVFTSPANDPGVSLPTNDIMSYDSPNVYFADGTFNLTDVNYNPATGTNDHVSSVVPKYDGTTLTTQNSFTYLEQVLGDRPDDGLFHVVHGASVDPNHYTAPPATTLWANVVRTGTIGSTGDHVVYWLKANGAGTERVHVTPTEAGGLIPSLLIYNQGNLVQYDDSYWNSNSQQEEIHTTVSLTAGQTYAFVVGGAGANSTGGYQIRVNASGEETTVQNPDGSLSSLYSDLSQVPPYEQTTVQSTVLGTWSGLSGTPGVQGTTRLVGVGTYLPTTPPATTIADPAGDVPVTLPEAEVLSLGSDPSFVASAQDPGLQAALAEIAAADLGALSAQTIAFDALADHTYGDAAFSLDATASSGLPVSYVVLSGPATIQDGVLTITGAGTVTIEASQAGDGANFDAATPVDQAFTVNKAHLSVSANNQMRLYGQDNPGFQATISGFVNGETLETSGVSGPVAFNCTATVNSPAGMYAISADLGGLHADNYDFTAVDGQLIISQAATTITLQTSVRSTAPGQVVTFTATVASEAGMPSGTVTFKDGATVLGTATLNNGVAVLQTTNLAAGSHAITAVYGSDGNFADGTSTAVLQTVKRAASKVTLASSARTVAFGHSITLTARISAVAPGTPAPSGTVTFKDGATVLGTASVKNGVAVFHLAGLKKGKHSLTVVYGGDADFAGSTSITLAETVR